MEGKEFYQFLLERYAEGVASEEEVRELFIELEKRRDDDAWEDLIEQVILKTGTDERYDEAYWHPAIQRILTTRNAEVPVRKMTWKKWIAAAAILLLFGTAVTFYFLNRKENKEISPPVVKTNEITPGRQGAILTLADNSQVMLDSIKNGTVVALQGGTKARVVDGNLSYDSKGSNVVYNTITTPNGRQYRVKLPDGTNVWLNSASSIRYPTAFLGTERSVVITGEAYLEVTTLRLRSGQKMPFRVNLDNKTEIQVLGTRFNVNAYPDETTINTTLLEGAVNVKAYGKTKILKPGQEAQVTQKEGINVVHANVSQVVAWKNGLFDFTGKDVRSVLREIARWYDLDLVYESEPANREIVGKMQMSLSLSYVMETLKDLDINYRIQGRKLIISK